MDRKDGLDKVPSYDESERLHTQAGYLNILQEEDLWSLKRQETNNRVSSTIQTQFTSVEEQRIRNLIGDYIEPQITAQCNAGLSKTTLILVPSNVLTTLSPSHHDSKFNPINPSDIVVNNYCTDRNDDMGTVSGQDSTRIVVGFSKEEDNVQMIRLKGDDNRIEFWRQEIVLSQLASALRYPSSYSSPLFLPPKHPQPTNSTAPSWSTSRSDQLSTSSNTVLGRLHLDRAGLDRRRLHTEVKVDVHLHTIGVRTISPFGLWETRTGEGIAVVIQR